MGKTWEELFKKVWYNVNNKRCACIRGFHPSPAYRRGAMGNVHKDHKVIRRRRVSAGHFKSTE